MEHGDDDNNKNLEQAPSIRSRVFSAFTTRTRARASLVLLIRTRRPRPVHKSPQVVVLHRRYYYTAFFFFFAIFFSPGDQMSLAAAVVEKSETILIITRIVVIRPAYLGTKRFVNKTSTAPGRSRTFSSPAVFPSLIFVRFSLRSVELKNSYFTAGGTRRRSRTLTLRLQGFFSSKSSTATVTEKFT